MSVELEVAVPADVDAFIALLEDASRWMIARGIAQWWPGEAIATADRLRLAQTRGELCVVRRGSKLVAGVVLSSAPDPIWDDSPNDGARYVHRLVIANDERGNNLGRDVLDACERRARAAGARTLRLDCVATNVRLARFYQALGYYPRGVRESGGAALLRHDKRLSIDLHDRAPGAKHALEKVTSLAAVDFDRFRPDDVATLCFVRDGERVLLIEKLRGHGAGKVNAPGGKLERGESARECAQRETREEVGVDVDGLSCRAELRFQDTNGYAMRGFAFVAESARGEPRQTDEAVPFWCAVDALPLERMWDDDRLWLPRVLDGESIVGEFLFDREQLIEHRLRTIDEASLATRADVRLLA